MSTEYAPVVSPDEGKPAKSEHWMQKFAPQRMLNAVRQLEPTDHKLFPSFRTWNIALSLFHTAIGFTVFALLIRGSGTKMYSAYIFSYFNPDTGTLDTTYSSKTKLIAEAPVIMLCVVAALYHGFVAYYNSWYIELFSRLRWNPLGWIVRAVQNIFIVVELALLAQMSDIEKVAAIVLLYLWVDLLNLFVQGAYYLSQTTKAPASKMEAGDDVLTIPLTDSPFTVHGKRVVTGVLAANLIPFAVIWLVFLTNFSWQVTHHHIESYVYVVFIGIVTLSVGLQIMSLLATFRRVDFATLECLSMLYTAAAALLLSCVSLPATT